MNFETSQLYRLLFPTISKKMHEDYLIYNNNYLSVFIINILISNQPKSSFHYFTTYRTHLDMKVRLNFT